MPRINLSVPYSDKDEAKKLGAKWDAKNKIWYIPTGFDPARFKKWEQTPSDDDSEVDYTTKRGFHRQYDQKCGHCLQRGIDVYLNLRARKRDGRRYIACPSCGKVFTPPRSE